MKKKGKMRKSGRAMADQGFFLKFHGCGLGFDLFLIKKVLYEHGKGEKKRRKDEP